MAKIKEINLQACRDKESAIKLCEENGTTIKEVVLENISTIIDELQNISQKIGNNERGVNEDWTKVAMPLNSMMNALGNVAGMWNNFVSFDLAKKLKDKGFREECLAYYTSEYTLYNNTICITDDKYLCVSDIDYEEFLKSNNQETRWENICDAPTVSQVIDWLRNKMGIYVIIEPYPSHSTQNKIIWSWRYKWKSDGQYMLTEDPDENTYLEYTEAAQACFNHIIDNLIHEVWQQEKDC